MQWRVRYLANLIMIMNEDGRFSPREPLVLSEVRNELSLTLMETADAVIQAVGERQPVIHANLITNERNLVDMLAGLLIDNAPQSAAVELFIDQAAIPKHRLPALLDDARARHAHLHRRVTTRLDGFGVR
jgi:hypothetical protein